MQSPHVPRPLVPKGFVNHAQYHNSGGMRTYSPARQTSKVNNHMHPVGGFAHVWFIYGATRTLPHPHTHMCAHYGTITHTKVTPPPTRACAYSRTHTCMHVHCHACTHVHTRPVTWFVPTHTRTCTQYLEPKDTGAIGPSQDNATYHAWSMNGKLGGSLCTHRPIVYPLCITKLLTMPAHRSRQQTKCSNSPQLQTCMVLVLPC
jgi:hypothetical protein